MCKMDGVESDCLNDGWNDGKYASLVEWLIE